MILGKCECITNKYCITVCVESEKDQLLHLENAVDVFLSNNRQRARDNRNPLVYEDVRMAIRGYQGWGTDEESVVMPGMACFILDGYVVIFSKENGARLPYLWLWLSSLSKHTNGPRFGLTSLYLMSQGRALLLFQQTGSK